MEGIQVARRQTPAPVQRAAAHGAETKKSTAPARTDSFQSLLTEAERAEQAAKAPGLPRFAGMTDKQKLSALATLHDATDYSGLTDAEKYRLINDRFEAAFPYLGAYESGLIGRDSANYFGMANMARPVEGTASRIQKELSRQWDSQGLQNRPVLHREAYYSGLTDGETAQAAVKRHKGGNLAAQASALQELKILGLGNQGNIDGTLKDMRAKLVQWVKKSRGYAGETADNATQEEAICALATGRQPRCTQKSTDWGALKRALEESAEDWDQTIANGYGRYVQSVIDSLVDEIVRGEAQDSPDKAADEPAADKAAELSPHAP